MSRISLLGEFQQMRHYLRDLTEVARQNGAQFTLLGISAQLCCCAP